jgi:DTW domain-containing protein YfiP
MQQNQKIHRSHACSECLRPKDQCFCGRVETFSTGIRVLILQHPQETLKLWNSARLAHGILENSALRVGLSWPNLRKAAGVEAMPSRWGVQCQRQLAQGRARHADEAL